MESLQELLTSDSEGSYVGAGRPRELQSPIGLHRTEVRTRPLQRARGGGGNFVPGKLTCLEVFAPTLI